MYCYTQCPQTLQQATTHPRLCWRLLDTQTSPEQSLVGSLLLSPGAQGSVCAPQESIFQPCVSSGSSMVGLMATSSKRACTIPKSAAPRVPVPTADHCWPAPPQETLRHSSVSDSEGPGSRCTQALLEPSEHLWREWGLILNANLPLLPSCWGCSFATGCGVSLLNTNSKIPFAITQL